MSASVTRNYRQVRINTVVARLFGACFLTPRNRMERLFEEVAELGQALDYPEEEAVRIVRLAYQGQRGEVRQEIGGVSVCLLSLCEVLKESADDCELAELRRLEAKRPEEMAAKLAAKLASGIVTMETEDA